jgi:phosphohistidine swiveling domain-containing protein
VTLKAKFVALGACVTALLVIGKAHAEPNDEAAKKLSTEAINVDYLSTDFPKAKAKLDKALALCSKEGACSAKVVALIHRELGVVYVAGLNNAAEGKKHFESALAIDPTIELDKDLTSKDIQATFDEAKAEIGQDNAPPAPKAAPVAEAPNGEKPPAGEIVHQPAAEQAVLTPVPIYVELPEGVAAAKVTVRYKAFGAAEWKSVEMSPRKNGFGTEIPCLDVGSTTGNLEYFIVASDASGDVVAFGGTRNQPYRVAIKHELAGEPPHLPGKPPPAQCQDVSDCPPGFPGCMSADKGVDDKHGSEDGAKAKKNWLSLTFQQDILLMSSSSTACSGGNEYACFYENPTTYYADVPYSGSGNEITGGPGAGTMRILAGFDRAITQNFLIGARLGYAFGGGPQAPDGNAFFPFHGEARVSYYFGNSPLGRKGIRPYVHVSGGVAQIDARVRVPVYRTAAAYTADKRTDLAAWKKAGTGFAGLGVGLMYALTETSGPYVDVQVLEMLGVSGTSISPQLGYAVGF